MFNNIDRIKQRKIIEFNLKFESLLSEFSTEKITKEELLSSFAKITNKLFARVKSNEERSKIYKIISLKYHPDTGKDHIDEDLCNKFFQIINYEYTESLKSRKEKISDFIVKYNTDPEFKNKINADIEKERKAYSVQICIFYFETAIFAAPSLISLAIPLNLIFILDELNIFILNNLSSNTWNAVVDDYRHGILFDEHQLYKKRYLETHNNDDYLTFDDFKASRKEDGKYPVIFVTLFKLYFIYLYKALIKNEAKQSLPKRIILLPIYATMFFVQVAIEMFRLAILVLAAALFLTWAATVLITGLVLIAPHLIFRKLFCKKDNDNTPRYHNVKEEQTVDHHQTPEIADIKLFSKKNKDKDNDPEHPNGERQQTRAPRLTRKIEEID